MKKNINKASWEKVKPQYIFFLFWGGEAFLAMLDGRGKATPSCLMQCWGWNTGLPLTNMLSSSEAIFLPNLNTF